MAALDVITLDEAKNNLRVDFSDDDAVISRIIKTSIDWVERYTCHKLWQRDETIESDGCPIEVYDYPVTVSSVTKGGIAANYTTQKRSLKLIIDTEKDAVVLLSVGYGSVDAIPSPLLDACYKIITYLYENRDAYGLGIPVDIQGLINQYRRGIF